MRQHLTFETVFADRKNLLLYFIEQIVHFILLFERTAHAFSAGGDDLAQNVFVANDLEVVADIRRSRHKREKTRDERSAADGFEQVPVAENLREGDQVDALTGIPEFDQHVVNRLVCRDVEIFSVNFLDAFRDDFTRRNEHRAENTLLGLYAVRQRSVNILGRTCE